MNLGDYNRAVLAYAPEWADDLLVTVEEAGEENPSRFAISEAVKAKAPSGAMAVACAICLTIAEKHSKP